MKIFGFHADVCEIFGEIFRELFGQGRDEDPVCLFLLPCGSVPDNRRLGQSAGLTSMRDRAGLWDG